MASFMIAALGSTVWAGPALDDDKKAAPMSGTSSAETPAPPADTETPVDYGVGIRLREVFVPAGLMGLFVARTPGGAQNTGIGVELIRRRGATELQLGFEYEHITLAEGVIIEKGKNVPGDESDFILSPERSGHDLGWFTIDFTFVNHAQITKQLQFRYGGGAGLGIITGELDHYNIVCAAGSSNNNIDPGCLPPIPQFPGAKGTFSDDGSPKKYDLPPVFPVVNAIIGLQYKPTDALTINLEGGIRTLPFIGVSSAYFF